MFIQTERTPNPATLKFLPGRQVVAGATADFPDPSAAERSPLALALFAVDGVTGVFLGADFITVTKAESGDWQDLKPQLLGVIMQHFSAGHPVLLDSSSESRDDDLQDDPADAEIVGQIKTLLDQKVRPAVARDGGDIIYQGFREGVVYLHMQGACAGCPSSTATLKHGIENLLRYYIPEVVEVRPIQG